MFSAGNTRFGVCLVKGCGGTVRICMYTGDILRSSSVLKIHLHKYKQITW